MKKESLVGRQFSICVLCIFFIIVLSLLVTYRNTKHTDIKKVSNPVLMPIMYTPTQATVQCAAPADTRESSLSEDDVIVIRLVIAESGNQPYAGQCAVAQVVYDRMHYTTNAFGGNSVKAVIYRGGQFAGLYAGDIYKFPNAIKAVDAVFHKGFRQFKATTVYFFNPKTAGRSAISWLRKHPYVGTIGNHEFRGAA
jgi:spore germination cell wall hydrolase CwlJ-like protein